MVSIKIDDLSRRVLCVGSSSASSAISNMRSAFYAAMVLTLGLVSVSVSGSDFCPGVCTCKWRSGKQSVECTEKNLITIPEGIDTETQLLDISGNNLQILAKETFVKLSLLDLQKVYLRNCSIGQIDDGALSGLSNVVDLDLSKNLITSIPSSIFEDVPNLRNISLANNPIQKIDPLAFRNAGSLTKLDLSHCQIKTIAPRAFEGVEYLELLRLNDNKLSELRMKTVDSLSGLHGIELHDNPWYCDCSLRKLKIWLVEKNVPYPIDPVCLGGPTRVLNKSFHQLHADDFACKPEIKVKPEYRYVDGVAGGNASIACKVVSIPRATITWHWNGRTLANNSNFSPYQRVVILETGDVERKSVLTLVNAQESDSSQFTCIAENQAGRAETNFTLKVSHRLSGFAILNSSYTAGISVVLIVIIFSILSAIVYLLFRIKKMPPARQIKRSNDEIIPNGTICQSNDNKTLTIEPSAEIKKSSYASSVVVGSTGGGGGHHVGGVGGIVGIVPYSRNDTTQTLPRHGDLSYRTAMFDDSAFKSAGGAAYNQQTSNPDLIADTRYQDGIEAQHVAGGQYTRANDILYPSSLWNQNEIQQFFATNNKTSCSSSDFRGFDTNDKTPIIEEVSSSSFYDNNTCSSSDKQRAPKDCNEFPTTSSPSESSSIPGFNSYPHTNPPNAKTIRVWQKGVQVLPPVTTLKRVLIRASPDEGYLDGCGTDV